jgi:peptide-methionine (S)-S-oxide reductase
MNASSPQNQNLKTAIFGGGCFWCLENIFSHFNGVHKVISGYADGHAENPTYDDVCSGQTGHAEVIEITYDPELISYEKLLHIFWHIHDPTTLNRQGNDIGTQYRSIILFQDNTEQELANASKEKVEDEKLWPDPIVTEIKKLETFYPAEAYHQSYFENNPGNPYCQAVIGPKVAKVMKEFSGWLK